MTSVTGYSKTKVDDLLEDKATAAQGAKADSAVQPADVYGKTASDARYATAAQGSKADSAVQPAALTTETNARTQADADLLTAINLKAPKYDISGNVTSAQVQAAIDAKSAGQTVWIGPGTVDVTTQVTINGQIVRCAGTIFKVNTSVVASDLPRMVLISGDKSEFRGPATLDGNRTAREAAGNFTTNQAGIQGLDAVDVRHIRVSDIFVQDVGCRSDVEPITRTFGAFSLQRSLAATQSVYGNEFRNIHLSDSLQFASFLIRFRTDFDLNVYGQQGHYLRNNLVSGGTCSGVGKNPIEMAGPDTIHNVVEDITITNTGGDAGADCAYGASWNKFKRIVVSNVNPRVGINGFSAVEFSALDKRAEIPGYIPKRTQGNIAEDCTLRDTTITRDGFFLRGFCDYDGIGNQFIRPKVYNCISSGVGSNVAGLSFVVMGYTDATEELSEDCHIMAPDFRGVQNGLRVTTGRVLRMRLIDPYIDASEDAIYIQGTKVLDRPEIIGGYVKGARFWSGNVNKDHLIDGVDIYYTGDSTPLPLPSAGGAPGKVVNCRIDGSGNPTVAISRTSGFNEIVENNTFVRIGFSGLALATSGPAQIRGNVGVSLATQSHIDSVSGEVFTDTGAPPTTGTWPRGFRVVNRTPVAGAPGRFVCVTAGTPGLWQPEGYIGQPPYGPAEHGFKAWTFDPATVAATSVPAAGVLTLSRVKWARGDTLTNLILHVGSAGAGLTSGQCFAAAFDSSLNLLGVTATQHTAWQSTGSKTMALTTPAANVQSDTILIGVWWNGTTGPAFSRAAASSAVNANLVASASRFATADTGLTATAPATAAALTAAVNAYWAAAS